MNFIMENSCSWLSFFYLAVCASFFYGLVFSKWVDIRLKAKVLGAYSVFMGGSFLLAWVLTSEIQSELIKLIGIGSFVISALVSFFLLVWLVFFGSKRITDESVLEAGLEIELLENLKTPILISNENFEISYANSSLLKLFGYQFDELKGQDINILIPERFIKDHNKTREDYAAKPIVREMGEDQSLFGISKLGKELRLDISITPTRNKKKWQYLLSFHDLTRILELESAKVEDNRIRRVLTDDLPLLISFVDKDLIYRFVNKVYQKTWNKKPEDIIGKSIFDLLPAKNHAIIKKNVKEVMAGNHVSYSLKMDIAREDLDSEATFYQCSYVPHIEENGEVSGFAVLAVDVTEMELNKKLYAIKNKSLEEYAYIVSHDLRAPMRHISNFTELLVEELIDANIKSPNIDKYTEIIIRNSLKMQEMITGMLTLSTVSNAKLKRERVPLLSYLKENLAATFSDADIDISFEIDENIKVNVDTSLFFQVFQNLISNSLKHTEEKPVIQIKVIKTENHIRLKYQDNSLGIDRKDFKSAIRPFWKKNNGTDGPGLGLSIVNRIVEQHGGIFSMEDSFEGLKVVMDWENL